MKIIKGLLGMFLLTLIFPVVGAVVAHQGGYSVLEGIQNGYRVFLIIVGLIISIGAGLSLMESIDKQEDNRLEGRNGFIIETEEQSKELNLPIGTWVFNKNDIDK